MEAKSQEGHRKRLRERFNQSGLAGFLDYEIVELMLTLDLRLTSLLTSIQGKYKG
jgi:DNA repair protein RadC